MAANPLRIPRKPHPEGEPLPAFVEMVLMLLICGGGLGVLWGAWELARWVWRVLTG